MLTTFNLAMFIVLYFSFFIFLSYKLSDGFDKSKVSFLVANRNAGLLESSLAAGASWILGIALFAASGFAYNMGWAGLFWFVVPQTIGMFIFAWFSRVCNERIPDGYTISGFIKEKYGIKVSAVYQFGLSLISLGFIVLTVTALTKFLTLMNVANIPVITGLVVSGTLIYSLKGGLKTNLITGSLQMIFMLTFCLGLLIFAFSNNGFEHLLAGINGKAGYESLFDPTLLTTFAIAIGLTSLTGIVGNQSYYQKSFSQQNTGNSSMSFILGGLFFAVVPVSLGILGMMAFGSGLEIKDASTAHLVWMQENVGILATLAFGFIVLNAASNAVDAQSNAFGAMVAHDFNKDESRSVWKSRVAIVSIAVVGWLLSTLNLDLAFIFLTYGVIRVAMFIVTILAVKTEWLTSLGILLSILIVAPITFYMNQIGMKMEAATIGFFITPIIAVLISRLTNLKTS
jgi:Na+/proline symporter